MELLIGRHVSAAGGVVNAPARAAAIGCNCFQIFSRSPRGGSAPKLTPTIVAELQANMKKFGQQQFYIHTPYYINLASPNNRIRHGSIEILRDELERGSMLGATAVMTHIGSSKEYPQREAALRAVVDSLAEVLQGYKGTAQFLLENAAGAGDLLGVGFEELGKIIAGVERELKIKNDKLKKEAAIGICLDTAHAFASGYDLRTKVGVNKMVQEFDRAIGIDRLVMLHANDSLTDFNAHRDRHEHIGDGKIGKAGFRAMLHHPKLRGLPYIMETPDEEKMKQDIVRLRKLAQ